MNFMDSECSSGCESGWTNYLEQSFLSANPSKKKNGFKTKKTGFRDGNRGKQKVEEEEEDLSMVSDASSGPPHFYEDVNGGSQLFHEYTAAQGQGVALNKNGGQRHRNKEQRRRLQAHDDDDTASSPFINYSKNNNNQAPLGFSATQFEGGIGSNFQGHFGFLQSSSPSANQLQSNQWF
ncbi:hypothetical protein like AT4G33800 [Hibiscus trionum]|uniref:Uncharacterized protein n=1 Tax=Hibiscus trionum TaxID=183268 RepID=A0A9W7I3H0_HIBTR|nr:hypothetical protein like AT4G33800 [Hibiscus trionum]